MVVKGLGFYFVIVQNVRVDNHKYFVYVVSLHGSHCTSRIDLIVYSTIRIVKGVHNIRPLRLLQYGSCWVNAWNFGDMTVNCGVLVLHCPLVQWVQP